MSDPVDRLAHLTKVIAVKIVGCWRCNNAQVIELLAGQRAPCPACYWRYPEAEQREIMWKCRPRARYPARALASR